MMKGKYVNMIISANTFPSGIPAKWIPLPKPLKNKKTHTGNKDILIKQDHETERIIIKASGKIHRTSV